MDDLTIRAWSEVTTRYFGQSVEHFKPVKIDMREAGELAFSFVKKLPEAGSSVSDLAADDEVTAALLSFAATGDFSAFTDTLRPEALALLHEYIRSLLELITVSVTTECNEHVFIPDVPSDDARSELLILLEVLQMRTPQRWLSEIRKENAQVTRSHFSTTPQ